MRTLVREIPCAVCKKTAPPISIWTHQIKDSQCRKALGNAQDALRRLFVLYNMGIPIESLNAEQIIEDVDWSEMGREEQAMLMFMLMSAEGAVSADSALVRSIENATGIPFDQDLHDDSNGDIPDLNISSNPASWQSWDDDRDVDEL